MKIKITIFTSLVVVILAVLVFSQTAPQKEEMPCGEEIFEFVLCVKTEKYKYKLGESIPISIFLKNTSNEIVEIRRSNKEYKYEVKDEANNLIEYSLEYKNNPLRGFISARTMVTIEPDEGIYNMVLLEKLYDLTSKRKYLFVAKRSVPSKNGKTEYVEITSNEIEIIIEDE